MKVTRKITHNELLNMFKSINSSVNVINWQPLVGDECTKYARKGQPIIRVDLDNGSWLRVYISEEFKEVTWY